MTPSILNDPHGISLDEGEKTLPKTRLLAGLGAGTMAGGVALMASFDPARSSLFPVCPLFALTGFACPGCGLTRGFHSLFNGDIIPAIDFNAMIPFWLVIFSWVFLSLALTAVRGRGLAMWPTSPKFLWVFMVVLFGFGILRNVPVWPLTILFP